MRCEVRYLDEVGGWVSATLDRVDARAVVRGWPVRSFPTYKGQQNYPGWLWTATNGSLVGYESLLERDRLWLADFDPMVRRIASQPFWISGRDGDVLRRHIPDFLLEVADSRYVVVDVKPAEMLAEPVVAAAVEWTGGLCAARGWRYEVWSGADPVLLRNVCFLAAGRRQDFIDQDVLGKVAEQARSGMSVAQIEAAAAVDPAAARAAVLALLWTGRWMTDLSIPLSADSLVEVSEATAA
ncbi:MAG: TnsA-like heteromeric transposase endonuclease subunit [Microlunatus sp.]